MIVQNAACYELTLTPGSYRIDLRNDKITGNMVNAILGYSGDGDYNVLSPFAPYNEIMDVTRSIELSMFLSLRGINKDIIRDLNLSLLTSEPYPYQHIEHFINKPVNFDGSFIAYKNTSNSENYTFLLYVFYQTRKFHQYTDDINGAVCIQIPLTDLIEDIPLSQYIDHTLNGKKIKQIICNQPPDDLYTGYLDLYGKQGEHLENIPLSFLFNHSRRKLFFDKIDIDFEKSYLRNRQAGYNPEDPLNFTFIY